METLDSLTVTILAEDSVGYETPYLGQHGISFLLRAVRGSIMRTILVDVAQHPDPLLFNMDLLGIDPSSIDTVVLTHCHYDHTQGLATILEAIGKEDLPVVAHPDIFRLNFIMAPYFRHVGVMAADAPERIREAGGTLVLLRDPLELMPGMTVSGEVPRVTEYEGHEMALKTIQDGRVVSDPMVDEVAVYASVTGVGTVVVTGCSHAGIVNISRHAKVMTEVDSLAAVIGGFHLIESTPEMIRRSVADLKAETVGRVLAGHCTGFAAQVELNAAFDTSFEPLRTGNVYSFSA